MKASRLLSFFLALVVLLGLPEARLHAQSSRAPVRYEFKIDPKTPLADLLPAMPDDLDTALPWKVETLDKTPEIFLQKPAPLPAIDRRDAAARDEALKNVAHDLAKVNHINKAETDHFISLLRQHRPDLAGLPWIDEDACRMNKEDSKEFMKAVPFARSAWLRELPGQSAKEVVSPKQRRARLAALTQIHGPADKSVHVRLIAYLDNLGHPEGAPALVRLALFSADDEVRATAIQALQRHHPQDYSDQLLAGLRYPWPEVAENAADAIIYLKRQDQVVPLIDLLDEPDPQAPYWKKIDGQDVPFVREVVRVNHNRNCLLCHAPANAPDIGLDTRGRPVDVAAGPVPSPYLPLPATYYREPSSPDILVRADVTYLRQDFSLMLPVKDARPWPDSQRFDFLVRERQIGPEEADGYFLWLANRRPESLSAYHRTIHYTLAALLGRQAHAPIAEAWRTLLKKQH